MKTADQKRRLEQLALFEPRPNRPSWTKLPLDSRQEVVRILVKMLVEHRTRDRGLSIEEGKVQ